jgi:hypothetical protein
MVLRRIRRKWIRNSITVIRLSRAVTYVLISLSGLLAIIIPPASVRAATEGSGLVVYAWAGLLALSAAICAAGTITGRWLGEYIGLIPLAFSCAAFALSALARGASALSGGFFLLGFFAMLLSRWQEVALVRIAADRLNHVNHADRGVGENR